MPRRSAVREQSMPETADLQQSVQLHAERSAAKQWLKATYDMWPEQDRALTAMQLYEWKHAHRCDQSA